MTTVCAICGTALGRRQRKFCSRPCQWARPRPKPAAGRTQKRCSACGQAKVVAEFARAGLNLQARCRSCVAKYNETYHREHREALNARQSERAEFRALLGLDVNQNLWRRYCITWADHEAQLLFQGSRCLVCFRDHDPKGGRSGVLHTDHDHDTGRFRGLLCSPCNRAIGLLRDDVDQVGRLLTYLSGSTSRG